MSIFNKNKAISPIIATILLVVVAVILITIIISWGKDFTNVSLNKTQDFGKLKVSDASSFVYPKSYSEGTMQFIYSPPESIKSEEIIITHYQILDLPEVEPIPLAEPYNLRESTNILPLNCLYEYSLSSPDFTIQLITDKNTYITIKQRDPNMVCTSGGAGTEEDPIIICNAEDLNNVRNDLDANYILGKNIDLRCFSRQTLEGWEPIGKGPYSEDWFFGNLNGNNHVINNLYINKPETNGIGLFDMVGGIITNIGLKDVNIIGRNDVGSLVAVGGARQGAYVSNSYSTGTVIGNEYVGGLIGNNSAGLILNCYSFVNVYSNFGGGLTSSCVDGFIENSFSAGIVGNGEIAVGGLLAEVNNCTITNSFWDTNVSGQDESVGDEVGKTTTEMKTQSTFSDWDFSTVWAMAASTNSGYPYLINNTPN